MVGSVLATHRWDHRSASQTTNDNAVTALQSGPSVHMLKLNKRISLSDEVCSYRRRLLRSSYRDKA